MPFLPAVVPFELFYLLNIIVSSKHIHSSAITVNISNPLFQLRKPITLNLSTDLEVESLDGGVELSEVILFDIY